MVNLYDNNNDNERIYAKNPITKTTFLTRLYDHPEGIDCRCESISKIFPNPLNDSKPSFIANIRILDYMPQCKAYQIDDDGQYVEILDQLSRKQKVLTTMNGQGQEVSMNFNLKESDEHFDEFFIHKASSFYPLMRYALINANQIPYNYNSSFSVSYDEIKKYLVGLTFNATVKRITPEKFNAYNVLIATKPNQEWQQESIEDFMENDEKAILKEYDNSY